ncbi:MAG: metallophosphoesterase family protein [Thermodesulfobacteriota bacterium]
MRCAVVSDIHSNIEALTETLKEIDSIGADLIVSLGDIVGYNTNPNECVALVRERNILSIAGNHDIRAAGQKEPDDFNEAAREAILWTREKLSTDNAAFLRELPESLSIAVPPFYKGGSEGINDKFVLTHGAINSPDIYTLSVIEAAKNFRLMEKQGLPLVGFFGHTHIKAAYAGDPDKALAITGERFKLKKDLFYFINPGSVGQPRDKDARASFLIFDGAKNEVSFYRVEYDIKACADKIKAAGLPEILAERLFGGY